jgi:GNAT superfamily N-acetyltransferase
MAEGNAATARAATEPEVAAVAQTLASAFFDDPVWGWVFADQSQRHRQLAALWGLFVAGSIEHGWVWTTPAHGAVAVWIPPGCPELTEPYEQQLEPLVEELLGPRSTLLLEVFARFEAAHPQEEPHFYLSLLGTHPDHRGHGIGMRLLAENLARIDHQHVPAYLESSNPVNLSRYETVGFEPYDEFTLPEHGPTVTTMWRAPR